LLYYPAEAIRLQSGLNLAVLTQFLCPKYDALNFKVPTSHNLTVLSSEAESKNYPSKENSTDLTGAWCPLISLLFLSRE
jgi:hypothetical protein